MPVRLDGEQMGLVELVEQLNGIAGAAGFGRIDMIENRYVGIKSRECYEVPAGLAIIQAHKALEDLCLERDVLHYEARARADVGGPGLQRPVVQPAQAGARRLHGRHAGARSPVR